ncbi:hypothetical protein BSZ19_04865 [Bradyrhizobium japonicum]|uniref:Uncharacterized protein n=1 Tax=Bradyrhizobium japonicum TaxID=375 RepID=A0A1Y2JWD1_BRAJP|nr:hypothetical protein [Bradyrhizobium japonicum]OSJ36316.1 hypothetical protein BSZ19_04865 [Bradyrhizobium japonicum]
MSDVPRAFRELGELIAYAEMSDTLRARLVLVRSWLPRQRSIRRAPISSVKLTPSVKQRIHDIKVANPKLSEQEIAVMVNVNAGWVSETLTGKRGRRFAIEGYGA